MKQKTADSDGIEEFGVRHTWIWTGIDVESKLMVSWYVGSREAISAHEFMADVASNLTKRMQLTTDGFKTYLKAVDSALVVK